MRGGDVLVVVADEVLPEAIGGRGTVPFSAAAVLRAAEAAPKPKHPARSPGRETCARCATPPRPSNAAWATRARASAFSSFVAAVADAAERGLAGRVELTAGGASRWSIAVAPTPTIMTASTLPDLRDLVPHEPPMLLLDAVQSYDDESVVCTVTIAPDGLFVEQQNGQPRVPAVIGLEYMAQCVAAYAGLTARQGGRPPRIGFLIGCRELRLDAEAFSVGDTLEVEARRVWGENDLGSFACAVKRAGEVLGFGHPQRLRRPAARGGRRHDRRPHGARHRCQSRHRRRHRRGAGRGRLHGAAQLPRRLGRRARR